MRTAATLPARALVLVLVAPGEGILDVAVHDPAGVTWPHRQRPPSGRLPGQHLVGASG
jgi:hypothetical protein